MPARLRHTLIGLVACTLAALVGVALAARGRPPESGGATSPGVESARSGFEGATRPPGARAPDFRLRDQDGRVVRPARYSGRPVIYTFLYATCEDTCPVLVQQIRGALDRLGEDHPVLGVSVDPANDTPRAARRFLLEQRMTGRMRFLLGDRAQLAPVWRAFGIAPQEHGAEHSAYVVLVDGRGLQRVGFPASRLTVRGLEHDLRRLLAGA